MEAKALQGHQAAALAGLRHDYQIGVRQTVFDTAAFAGGLDVDANTMSLSTPVREMLLHLADEPRGIFGELTTLPFG